MISAKFLWGNVLFGGKLQIGAKNSNFEIFESALYMKSLSMPLMASPLKLKFLPTVIEINSEGENRPKIMKSWDFFFKRYFNHKSQGLR